MTILPVGVAQDERWVRHEGRSFFAGAQNTTGPYGDLGVAFPAVDADRRWLVERVVATTNTICQQLRVGVDRGVAARRRATREPADLVDFVAMPGVVCVLCRPYPIVVPEEAQLVVEWTEPGAPPNAGMEVAARIDVTILRRL